MTVAAAPGVPSRPRLWLMGARPRTLGASLVPVAVGAAASGHARAWPTALAAVVALALQVGVNYANDYFDGIRGVDDVRVGPTRLTASGLASPRSVAVAAGVALGVAVVAGAVLALTTQPLLLVAGGAAVLAAVLYSGGRRPYASLGLGEVMVFVFFGLVAVCGTAYANAGRIPAAAWWAALTPGLLATALLLVNNLRDVSTDTVAGKRTLAVRLGERWARWLLVAMFGAAVLAPVGGVLAGAMPRWALLELVAAPLVVRPVRLVLQGTGRAIAPALGATARLQLVAGALLTAGLALG